MSACLHLFFDADVENLALQTYTDVKELHKIRFFLQNVCMSAKYILYIINFFILIYYMLVILNF